MNTDIVHSRSRTDMAKDGASALADLMAHTGDTDPACLRCVDLLDLGRLSSEIRCLRAEPRRNLQRKSMSSYEEPPALADAQRERDQHKGAPMAFFDWLTGTKRPAAGVPAKSAAEVRADLLAVNKPTAPFGVRDGAPENVDLVAEWRIVDAEWYVIFAKAGLKKVFKVLMKLDEQAREVRAVDQEWSVEWRAGVPTLSLDAEASR